MPFVVGVNISELPASQVIISSSHSCRPHSCNLYFPIYLLKVNKHDKRENLTLTTSREQQTVGRCAPPILSCSEKNYPQSCYLNPKKTLRIVLGCRVMFGGMWRPELRMRLKRQSRLFEVCERPKINWTVSSDKSLFFLPVARNKNKIKDLWKSNSEPNKSMKPWMQMTIMPWISVFIFLTANPICGGEAGVQQIPH